VFNKAFILGALAHSFSGRFLQASWRPCRSSSGFSLSQFFLFLLVIRLHNGEIRFPCGTLAVVKLLVLVHKNLAGLLQLMAKEMFGNVN